MDTGWVLYLISKSGKIVLDTQGKFNREIAPHYENKQQVTINQVHNSCNPVPTNPKEKDNIE